MLAPCLSLRYPVLRALAPKINERTRDHRVQHLPEGGALLDDIGKTRVNISELLVEENDPVFGIVKHEPFGDRGDRGCYCFALCLRLGGKAVAFPQAVTKQAKSARHSADFVMPSRGDRY